MYSVGFGVWGFRGFGFRGLGGWGLGCGVGFGVWGVGLLRSAISTRQPKTRSG